MDAKEEHEAMLTGIFLHNAVKGKSWDWERHSHMLGGYMDIETVIDQFERRGIEVACLKVCLQKYNAYSLHLKNKFKYGYHTGNTFEDYSRDAERYMRNEKIKFLNNAF